MSYFDCSKSDKIRVLIFASMSILTLCLSLGVVVGCVEPDLKFAEAFALLGLSGMSVVFAGNVCNR